MYENIAPVRTNVILLGYPLALLLNYREAIDLLKVPPTLFKLVILGVVPKAPTFVALRLRSDHPFVKQMLKREVLLGIRRDLAELSLLILVE